MSARGLHALEFFLGIIALLIFFNSPVVYIADSKYTMLTAESLLRNGTPDLSTYKIPRYDADLPFNTIRGLHAYQLARSNGRLLYGFPHGSSFLSVPFVALFDLFGISAATPDRDFNLAGEIVLQKTLAAALMAVFVVIALRSALLVLDPKWSVLVAAATGLGTQVWSVASRGVWSHTWEITLGMAVVYLLLRSATRAESIHPVLLATLLAWMYFVRPTGAIQVLAVSVYVVLYRRGEFPALAITGLAWMLILLAYTMRVYGTILPFYYGSQLWSPATIPLGIYGNLLGPSRGLFVYSPVFAVVFYWLFRYWERIASRPLAIVSIVIFAATLLSVATHLDWWGGLCFGPRYVIDALPWLVLLAIMAVGAIPPERRSLRNPAMIAAALTLLVSVAINGEGAFSTSAQDWNYRGPLPAIMLDWSHPQFLAPWQERSTS